MSTLKATLGFKGEKGDSAYVVAVNNGFVGTEQDWLATLGTTNYVGEEKATYSAGAGDTIFGLPSSYTSESVVEVFIEGEKLNSNEYTVNQSERTVVLQNAISVDKTTVEIMLLKMASYELPIVETINIYSTNDTVPGTKAVYNLVKSKFDTANIKVLTGSIPNIVAGATAMVDVSYPSGFTKSNTVVISKMSSSNNVYYDSVDIAVTTSGFPKVVTVALMDTGIRIWMKNISTSETKIGYYKITLLRQ